MRVATLPRDNPLAFLSLGYPAGVFWDSTYSLILNVQLPPARPCCRPLSKTYGQLGKPGITPNEEATASVFLRSSGSSATSADELEEEDCFLAFLSFLLLPFFSFFFDDFPIAFTGWAT